ncbi:hypothetical protein J3R82DRAFT_2200 [Butyriboletus roseoflavus]|nr:hypothetical protein J3R82DRAFT_2200 [Butyriboletus roseoflavus]
MFRAGQTNPYDDIVVKATDENLTSENWEVILNLCDKVQEEVLAMSSAALIKRLAHRSPNVQLYSLSLAESLSKNCRIDLHRELASRAFTQALEKLISDRTTHDKVRKRALNLVAVWTAEFDNDSSLGVMEECYNNLKAKNYKFEPPDEPAPPTVDDEARRREEEELQRVLEMSMHDKGGRTGYAEYSAQSSGAGGSSSALGDGPSTSNATEPNYPSGYVPAQGTQRAAALSTSSLPSQYVATPAPASAAVGEIIKVVDRGYKDWWRGQLKGRTGIFPVNYVEPLPELTAVELAREVEQEAAVFAQAANVDRLLTMLRTIDSSGENLADNEEIQELYRSCMSLRPKIVKLIDKYSQKRADLVSMNESFVKARVIFDRMMEDSLARHGMYEVAPRQDYSHGQAPYARQEYGSQLPYGYPPAPTPGFDQQSPQQQSPYGYVAPAGYPEGSFPQQHADPGLHDPLIPNNNHSRNHQPQSQPQPQPQPQLQPQPQAQQQQQYHPPAVEVTQAAQPQVQSQPGPEQSGPPYVYDPHTTYADPNVQAWAQYYAQGGKSPAGAVYFFSVPGVTDGPPNASPQGPLHPEQGVQPQGQSVSPTQTTSQVTFQPDGAGQSPYFSPASATLQPQGSYGYHTDPPSSTPLPSPQTGAGAPYSYPSAQPAAQSPQGFGPTYGGGPGQ